MKAGRPSLTAVQVSLARAIATHDRELARVCQDPWAERLLPAPIGATITRLARSRAAPQLFTLLRAGLRGLAEHMALRTHMIDEVVTHGVGRGARQLVVLGAGLDSRAHRLSALAECDVFEVDFPSTQAFKRERARALPLTARRLRYVPCDFERESLEEVLLAHGFAAQVPTVWIWEGVTMYLSEALVASTLDLIARMSAPGSQLVLSYLVPLVPGMSALRGLMLAVLAAAAEPIRGRFTPDEMQALLAAHGFSVASDESQRECGARHGMRVPPFGFGALDERVAVAGRRALT